MAALPPGGGLGSNPVLGPVKGGVAPASDDLGGADAGGEFRSALWLDWHWLRGRAGAAEAREAAEATATGERKGQEHDGSQRRTDSESLHGLRSRRANCRARTPLHASFYHRRG